MKIIRIKPLFILLLAVPSVLVGSLVQAQPTPSTDKSLAPVTATNESPPPWEARPDAVTRAAQTEGAAASNDNASIESWYRNRKRASANIEDEFASLKAQAQSGKADAQYRLALLYRSDENPQADIKQSLEWQQKAAQAGYAEAQYGLGMLYANGQFVAKDIFKAHEWLQKAAEQKHIAAKLALESLPEVEVVEQRETISASPATKQNSVVTTKVASATDQTTAPSPKALPNAAKLSSLKAKPVEETAREAKAEVKAPPTSPKPPKTALAQAQTEEVVDDPPIVEPSANAAEDDTSPIQTVAMNNNTVGTDDVATIKQAAEGGDSKAQLMLGTMYEDGANGLTQDLREAARWYKEAAKSGYVNAQYNLGLLYEDGRGVKQDYNQAAFWYEKAAKSGFVEAKNNLGVLYVLGNGVKKDPKQAEKLFREAAAKGNADAERNLAMLAKSG